MNGSGSRDKILSKLRNAPPFSWDHAVEIPQSGESCFSMKGSPLEMFKKELEDVGGEVFIIEGMDQIVFEIKQTIHTNQWEEVYCEDETINHTLHHHGIKTQPVLSRTVAISGCEFLIADTGSVVASTHSGPGRRVHVYPEVLIFMAGKSQLCLTMSEAIQQIKNKYNNLPSWIGMITGPSRTADIEKTLVIGAHGPKRLIVFVDLRT